ncbi:hypothetical protein [Kineococcus gynurae]|uniref:Uncharacterized protein n=1 Tax=Kineococcus gynurae TaxID=452979 RepID=A0ABV5LS96_9ACTN
MQFTSIIGAPGAALKDHGVVALIAQCTARLKGDQLVLTMADGADNSRVNVDEALEYVEGMDRLSKAASRCASSGRWTSSTRS